MRRVARVSPDASRGDAEFSETVAARHAGLRCEQRQAVHIGGRQTAACRQHGIRFSQARCAGARDHRRIVGAQHADRDHLRRAIRSRHRHAVRVARAADKFVVRRVARVSPGASRGDAEFSETVVASHAGLRREQRRAVHIGGRQTTASRHHGIRFSQARCADAADHGRIVRAGNSHAHGARHAATLSIQHIEAEGLNLGLASGQVLYGRIGHAVIPGDLTAQARRVICVGADAGCQCAQSACNGRHRADTVNIGEVHIAKGNGASVSQLRCAWRRRQLCHCTGHVGAGYDGRVVDGCHC